VVSELDLPFKPIADDFTVGSFQDRQTLYQRLCETIWAAANFGLVVSDEATIEPSSDEKKHYGVTLGELVDASLLRTGQAVQGKRGGVAYHGTITEASEIQLSDGRAFESPSAAGAAALDTQACNGWHFWQAETPQGLVRLSRIREDLLERLRG
jgi:hypothetical protein